MLYEVITFLSCLIKSFSLTSPPPNKVMMLAIRVSAITVIDTDGADKVIEKTKKQLV